MQKDVNTMRLDPFKFFRSKRCLLSSGNEKGFNTMTVSWLCIGNLWDKNVIVFFIRDGRYTNHYLRNNPCMTLSYLPKGYEDEAEYIGTTSGKVRRKLKDTDLKYHFSNGCILLDDASINFVLKKIYCGKISTKNIMDKEILKRYPKGSSHIMYIGEIQKIIRKKA